MEKAQVVELINEFNDKLNRDPMRCKFKIALEKNNTSSKDTHLDNIMSYNDILDYVEREHNNKDGDYWRSRKIISHSLIPGKKEKNKTGIEIQVVWETGTTSTESFEGSKKNIPVNLTIYAKENNLLELDGWDTLKRLADQSKLTERLVNQAKLHSLKYSPRYKYGFETPKNYEDAERLDRKNCNDDWKDANKLEHKQLREYDVFIDNRRFAGCRIPCGYQLIRVHTIFDVKVDGRHKTRVLLTDTSLQHLQNQSIQESYH